MDVLQVARLKRRNVELRVAASAAQRVDSTLHSATVRLCARHSAPVPDVRPWFVVLASHWLSTALTVSRRVGMPCSRVALPAP